MRGVSATLDRKQVRNERRRQHNYGVCGSFSGGGEALRLSPASSFVFCLPRSRSHLEPHQQQQLDALTAELGALFVDPLPPADPTAAADPDPDPAMAEFWEQLQVLMCRVYGYGMRAAKLIDANDG